MLKILHNIGQMNFSHMLHVYGEAVERTAGTAGTLAAEQALYDDLQLFFSSHKAICCVWEIAGLYVSCVRAEPYRDGVLLTCLETAPEARRRGYASSLLMALLKHIKVTDGSPVYVHVHKENCPSVALHKKLGFRVIADSARLVDGTVSTSFMTMKYE